MSDKAKAKPRGAMVTQRCANPACGKEFQARAADVTRGWGRSCSKSCSLAVRKGKATETDTETHRNDTEMPMNNDAKAERVMHANQLIEGIGSHGRKFLRCGSTGVLATFEIDIKGKVWYRDDYTRSFIEMRGERTRWTGFSHGGTLQGLVDRIAQYIETGKPLARNLIGYTPRGDGSNIWGYEPEALEACRAQCYALPIMQQEEVAAA